MSTLAIRQHLIADADHKIHLELPLEMGSEVEIIVWERGLTVPVENLEMVRLVDESGFAKQVLSSEEEDCWNDL